MIVPSSHQFPRSGRPFVLLLGVICSLIVGQLDAQEAASPLPSQQRAEEKKDTTSTQRDTIPLPRVPPPQPFSLPHEAPFFRYDAHELDWHDLKDVGDLLNEIPGFVTLSQSGAGEYNQAISSGIDWRGIAVVGDGRALNDPATGLYNFSLYPFENAQTVEVLTGPPSFIYGYNGAGAAVRLETKEFLNIIPFSKIRYEESAYNYQFSDGSFSQNVTRNTNLSLGFQHQSTGGRFDNSYYDSWNIRGKIRWSVSPRLHLSLGERYASNERGLSGGISLAKTSTGSTFLPQRAVVVNPDAYERNSRHDLDLSLVTQLFDDSTSLSSVHLYFSHALREYRDEENRATPNGAYVETDYRTDWLGISAQQSIQLNEHTLIVGGNVEGDRIAITPDVDPTRFTRYSLWGRGEVRLPSSITIGLFGRHDGSGGRSASGVGFDATISLAESFAVFGGASLHQRLPTFMEADRPDTLIVRTGPIDAEQHRLMQIGFAFNPCEGANLRLALFHRQVQKPIVVTPGPSGRGFFGVSVVNGPQVTNEGIELSGRVHIGWFVLEGSALHLLRKLGSGDVLSDQPKLSAQGGAYYWDTLLEGRLALKAGFRGSYTSGFTGPVFQPELLMYAGPAYPIGAGSRVDFLAVAHIGDAHVHVVWENLTNVQYYGTPFYPIPDRAFRFGISWEFLN